MEFSANQFRDYFLGICTDEDAAILEREFFENSNIQEAVLAAESELIDEYLDGELSAEDHAKFLENYLVTQARDLKVAEAKAFRSYFHDKLNNPKALVTVNEEKTSFFGQVVDWFAAKGLVTAGGIAILLLIGTVAVFVFTRRSEDLATKYASINKQDMSDLSRFNAASKLVLMPGSQRGTSDTSSVKPGASSDVLIRLALQPGTLSTDHFQINVKRGSVAVYSQNGLRAYENSNGLELRVVVPTLLLEKGEHQIYVTSVSKPSEVMNYTFKVE